MQPGLLWGRPVTSHPGSQSWKISSASAYQVLATFNELHRLRFAQSHSTSINEKKWVTRPKAECEAHSH